MLGKKKNNNKETLMFDVIYKIFLKRSDIPSKIFAVINLNSTDNDAVVFSRNMSRHD